MVSGRQELRAVVGPEGGPWALGMALHTVLHAALWTGAALHTALWHGHSPEYSPIGPKPHRQLWSPRAAPRLQNSTTIWVRFGLTGWGLCSTGQGVRVGPVELLGLWWGSACMDGVGCDGCMGHDVVRWLWRVRCSVGCVQGCGERAGCVWGLVVVFGACSGCMGYSGCVGSVQQASGGVVAVCGVWDGCVGCDGCRWSSGWAHGGCWLYGPCDGCLGLCGV